MLNFLDDEDISIIPNQIHIWFINLNDFKDKIQYLKPFLSNDEILKASKFKFKKDKDCSIITRSVLRLLSNKYLNLKAKNITFKYGKFGKPNYKFKTDLKFNVSHSGNMAVVAFVLNNDIGVDIVDHYFSESEIQTLNKFSIQDQVKGFYRCWTRKESFIKAKAKGLSFPLDSFSVSIDSDEKTELLETKWDKTEKDLWSLFSFSPQEGHIGALSVKGNIQDIKYFNLNEFI